MRWQFTAWPMKFLCFSVDSSLFVRCLTLQVLRRWVQLGPQLNKRMNHTMTCVDMAWPNTWHMNPYIPWNTCMVHGHDHETKAMKPYNKNHGIMKPYKNPWNHETIQQKPLNHKTIQQQSWFVKLTEHMKHSVEKHVRRAQTLGFVEKLHCRSHDTGGGMQLRTVPSTVLQECVVTKLGNTCTFL